MKVRASPTTIPTILGCFLGGGRDGITYLIQKSEDLVNWEYVLLIKPGQGARAKLDFTRDFSAKDEPFFIKLKYTDIETHDPWADDFDQDWISNWDELNQNTDPLASDSTDGDFIADDWEIFHMGNVSSMDNRSHADIDGLPDLLEFKQNSDPNRSAFTDADAYSDDFELFFGFDPADSEDPVIDNPTGTTYRYDAAGQLTAVFYASGKSLHYQYDSVGNMTLAY